MEEQNVQVKENKMGTMPINSLLISMSVPMMLSMLVQALYNIVDSMFVSRVSEDALTAVSLAFPVQSLMIAVVTGTGVGINALLSKSLGEKKHERASQVANNGLLLCIISALVFAVLAGFFSGIFYRVQTDNKVIADYGTAYVRICGIMSIGVFMQVTFEKLLQSTGRTLYSMVTQSLGAVINIILDPIMIFGLFGFPRLEVAGAALATITGQTCAALLGLWFNLKKNPEITLSLRKYRLSGKIVKGIYSVGVPSILMASIGSVMTFSMNKILIAFTSTATAVFGVYFKLQSFVFMPVFGLNNGMVPIVAYNYGAAKPDRIMKTIRLSIIYAMSIMLLGLVIFQAFPDLLLQIFNASDTMQEIGVTALRIISIHFVIAGFSIVALSVFQALGHGFLSLIISASRQLLVLLPAAYILSRVRGLSAIWWSFVIAELVAVVLAMLFLRYIYKKEIQPLREKQDGR